MFGIGQNSIKACKEQRGLGNGDFVSLTCMPGNQNLTRAFLLLWGIAVICKSVEDANGWVVDHSLDLENEHIHMHGG